MISEVAILIHVLLPGESVLFIFFIRKCISGHFCVVWATPNNVLFLVLLVFLPILALGLNLESSILKFRFWFSQLLMVLIWTITSLLSVLETQDTSVHSAHPCSLGMLWDNIETMCNSFGLPSLYQSLSRNFHLTEESLN